MYSISPLGDGNFCIFTLHWAWGGYPFKTASFFCGYLGASATQGRHEGWDTRFGFKPFTLQGEAGGKDSLLIIRCSLSDGIMAWVCLSYSYMFQYRYFLSHLVFRSHSYTSCTFLRRNWFMCNCLFSAFLGEGKDKYLFFCHLADITYDTYF